MIWEALAHLPLVRALVAEVDALVLAEVEAGLEWFGIASGTVLFAQGERSCDLYLLARGRLGVLLDEGTGAKLVGSIAAGSLVGEMAIISGDPRSATIVAARDSELVRFPAAIGRRLIEASRTLTRFLLQDLVDRVRAATLRRPRGEAVQAVALVVLDDAARAPLATAALVEGFRSVARELRLVEAPLEDRGGEEALEEGDALLVHLVPERGTAWARRAMRQSDRVVLVARGGSVPDRAAAAEVEAARRLQRPADLVLVHPAGARRPAGASAWLDLVPPDQVLHVREGDPADHARAARMVTGRGVGLVLSGGGARGFAHIGAIRALRDLGVPVDHICGVSMGALVGASAALDVDPEEVSRKVHFGAVLNNPFDDLTLPIVALARGRRMSALLRWAFDEARLEDTWKSFSCVSSNLSTGRVHLHQSGPIWRALRASAAIPGIVPPVTEAGEVLVDGGVMNNFPGDVARSFARGRVIGVEVSSRAEFRAAESDIEARSLAWMLGPGRGRFPTIFKLLVRAATVGSDVQAVQARASVDLLVEPELAGVDLLSFKRFDVAVEAGYRATRDAFEAAGVDGWR